MDGSKRGVVFTKVYNTLAEILLLAFWFVAMRLFAIDPGYEQSALVVHREDGGVHGDIIQNAQLLCWLRRNHELRPLVIEQIQSYGMAVGKTIFETVYWSGRFAEAWESRGGSVHRMPRRDVKLHLCGQSKAKDANIRQALIDRFGPTKEQAIGKKATPGPLYGFKSDMWAALAVAVTWNDKHGTIGHQASDALDHAPLYE